MESKGNKESKEKQENREREPEGGWEQLWHKLRPVTDPAGNYNGFCPSVTVLSKGYCHREGYRRLSCDIVWERDSQVVLRDGTKLYTDIFRPAGEGPFPVVISWSPYGKSNIDQPWAYDSKDLSHLQKEEGVDPALWCAHGYAVAHPDARGAYLSEGNIFHWGEPEGKDIYDYVEWLAAQPWCSGSVGMAGNSYLTIVQWFAAAQNPPHLKAIAPWEGQTDAYREVILQGGIADVAFPRQAVSVMHGENLVDDMPSMAEKYPFWNSYWEDKRAELAKITVPAYITASYTNPIHTHGTFRGYREIASREKWLRVHNSHEWVDFYRPENQADLMRFFDHYLKGMDNGWEKTPAVRFCLLNPGGRDETGLEASAFPPEGTRYESWYLNAENRRLEAQARPEVSFASYDGAGKEAAVEFRLTFQEKTRLAGYPSLRLNVQGQGCLDMDLFAEIGKEDAGGRLLAWDCTPPNRYQNPLPGFEGRLRLSLREEDPALPTEEIPVHAFRTPSYPADGETVQARIALRPAGLVFEKGETLVLRVGNELRQILAQNRSLGTANRGGTHVVVCGGPEASCLRLPVWKA